MGLSYASDRKVRFALAALALVATAAGCDRKHTEVSTGEVTESWEPAKGEAIKGVPAAAVTAAIQARVARKSEPEVTRAHWQHVAAVYSRYAAAPLWMDDDGVSPRAAELVAVLEHAPTEGLRLDTYPLRGLIDALKAANARGATADQIAEADVLLTATYVALAEDMLTGQIDPKSVSQGWHIDPEELDVDSALVRTIRMEPLSRAIVQLRPMTEDYDALRRELARYRQIAVQGGWPKIPDGEKLKPGEVAPVARIDSLLRRLKVEGYLPEDRAIIADTQDAGRAVYDSALAGAVAEYQRRHAIGVDSILGGETLQSLNLTATYRVGQLAANLERHRWLPRTLGGTHIFVNVPAFRLNVFEDGKEAMSMKVVVGSEYDDRATPAFADSMTYLEFSPYWNVPKEIAEKELWPKINADPSYLSRNNYELVTEKNGEQRIRQLPGPKNALGHVKFMFPNSFNIYLHDTPEDALFEKDVRAASHGCIRLEKPVELARWVLRDNPDWTDERMSAAMSQDRPRVVNLKRKVPVYIVYFTTFMRDGQLEFGNDLYDRDGALVKAVFDALTPGDQVRREIDELRGLVDA